MLAGDNKGTKEMREFGKGRHKSLREMEIDGCVKMRGI
jgi:hypothetical protein